MVGNVDLSSSYRGFLKISHPYDWSGVGCFYVGASLEYISGIACRCACNPYVACPVHPCKCARKHSVAVKIDHEYMQLRNE